MKKKIVRNNSKFNILNSVEFYTVQDLKFQKMFGICDLEFRALFRI